MKIIDADEIINILSQLSLDERISVKDIITMINIRDAVINVSGIMNDIDIEIALNFENQEYIDGLTFAKKTICKNTNQIMLTKCDWDNNNKM